MKRLLSLLLLISGYAQSQHKGTIQTDTVVSIALAHNITHENVNRPVTIYLPPSYARSDKRYPVLYLLHGIGDDHQNFVDNNGRFNTIQELMDTAIAVHRMPEMIIVMPNEKTNRYGSFYTNSAATGNWEDFTVQELVAYIDTRYRTIAQAASRAIAGHSMGGYGAILLAMKHPDVFGTTYGMNSAFIGPCGEFNTNNPQMKAFVLAKTVQDYDTLFARKQYVAVGTLTVAQAFSPNLSRPPLYIDKPFKMQGHRLVINPPVYQQWLRHDVVRLVKKYRANLLKLRGLKFDTGIADEYQFIPLNNLAFSRQLTAFRIPHIYEAYNGDHRNRLWGLEGRIYTEVFPFIAAHIAY
ncbi:alpha/beta hydrolase [Chitinophaga nivalis]|uniref:Alpha/beta hydrolase-fold protein n=1 Tax=Chitinophaga nivalis TaxID=2991709 RepID=A0ABT3IND6_9BACT|nr:alpha/beta hydrolase-fold protein [Chitinophaga nivalis]MCW3464816.1 alpha/beta hydrolase-fold protein [Chitinophaga nivalis]MCW3485493.1 alpha/beta hydrolase-fold protein [Chitinophaga nivalis]